MGLDSVGSLPLENIRRERHALAEPLVLLLILFFFFI